MALGARCFHSPLWECWTTRSSTLQTAKRFEHLFGIKEGKGPDGCGGHPPLLTIVLSDADEPAALRRTATAVSRVPGRRTADCGAVGEGCGRMGVWTRTKSRSGFGSYWELRRPVTTTPRRAIAATLRRNVMVTSLSNPCLQRRYGPALLDRRQ